MSEPKKRKLVEMPPSNCGGPSSRPQVCTSFALILTLALVLVLCQMFLSIESTIDKSPPPPAPIVAALRRANGMAPGTSNKLACDYDKGQWLECEPDGLQRKVFRLKSGGAPECKTNKTIRRECETTVGCKYERGQWSSGCVNGQRYRVDKLVARVGKTTAAAAADCKPQRRVTKDCRRTCHYLKSAWSECTNGFRTRTLTIDDVSDGQSNSTTPPMLTSNVVDKPMVQNTSCARHKLIRRKCRLVPPVSAVSDTTSTTAPNGSNITPRPGQRRRLKQFQQTANKRQQQQQQQQTNAKSVTSSPGPVTVPSGLPKPTGQKSTDALQVNINSTPTTTTRRRRR